MGILVGGGEIRQRNMLIIFSKLAELGRVKTRLISDLGARGAWEVYVRLLGHVSRSLGSWHLTGRVVYWSPSLPSVDSLEAGYFGLGDYAWAVQAGGDLGWRMYCALEEVFEGGAMGAILVGCDCPLGVGVDNLERAWWALTGGGYDAVLGPAEDGGYYLIGLRHRPPRELFLNRLWSHEGVAEEARGVFRALGWVCYELPCYSDIDRVEDLKHLP